MRPLALLLAAVGLLFVAAGLVVTAGGVIGLLRFPDFYTRLHALRVGDGLGAVLLLIGLALVSGDGAVALRLLLVAAFVIALGPSLSLACSCCLGSGELRGAGFWWGRFRWRPA